MDLIKKKSKIPRLIAGALIAAAILILLITILIAKKLTVSETPKTTIIKIGTQEIKAEIAATPLAAYRGLSRRSNLGANEGMLFNFVDKQEREFVMREMNFPLDIIFIDDDKIIKIAANLPPEKDNPVNIYASGQPVNRVLEVTGGYCREKGIKVGDSVLFSE